MGLFKKPKPPKPQPLPEYEPPPPPEPPPEMPDESALDKANKKKEALRRRQSGRASTFLSDEGETLG